MAVLLLDAQRYHRLKIALSKVERDQRTEFCVGCRGVWNLMLIL
uniref:Helix-turn-helix domain protein n=1 Tax=Podoviridae sp. cthVG1 TaxID=2827297 RepID=A0A8S5R9S5_9CAUD|nr:MAG TPA: helix-turn-helix domain protein [Podoviridae sp. cthVG1]